MNMKLKTLVVAVGMVVAGAANAALSSSGPPGTGGSDLIFEAWDGTTSYVMDLGAATQYDTFAAAAPSSAAFTVDLTGLNAATLQWQVFANNQGTASYGSFGVITTSAAGNAPAISSVLVTSATIDLIEGYQNAALGTATSGYIPASNSLAYAGQFGNNTVGTFAKNTAVTGFGSMGLYEFLDNGNATTAPATVNQFAGSFSLASNGTLTYGPAAVATPLPAAAWLFGSGLLGLVGVARRRFNAA